MLLQNADCLVQNWAKQRLSWKSFYNVVNFSPGRWEVQDMKDTKLPGDKGLVLVTRAKHHAISSKLSKPFVFDTKPLIVQ